MHVELQLGIPYKMTYDEKKFQKCLKIVKDAKAMLMIMGVVENSLMMANALPNLYVLFGIPEDITNPYKFYNEQEFSNMTLMDIAQL